MATAKSELWIVIWPNTNDQGSVRPREPYMRALHE